MRRDAARSRAASAGGLVLLLALGVLAAPATIAAQAWTAPTAEELTMTAQAEAPGAPAVYLFHEEISDDRSHSESVYTRVKILTEGGKSAANVEIPYTTSEGGFTVEQVLGRTIQPDGSIVPFTGKPFEKLIEKKRGTGSVKAKVFSLPDVRVGSIIEFRYRLFFDDNYVHAPDWYLQQDYFVRKVHFRWLPSEELIESDKGNVLNRIAWMPILPAGTKVERMPNGGYELTASNVMPLVEEDFSPPLKSVSQRVQFYYTGYKTRQEFWETEGKHWAKERDAFIGPGKGVKAATQALLSAGDTDEQKLGKIYAFVMTLDNTRWSRTHSANEDRAQGFKPLKSTDDVLERKRGSDDQIAELFVAMARAAGYKAYVAAVADRSKRLYVNGYLSLAQLDDLVAIVVVGDKERAFDPGQRYCSFGQLAWEHAPSNGLRQVDGGSRLFNAVPGPYQENHVVRKALLKVDETGAGSGSVTLTFTGNPALDWRHEALEKDEAGLSLSFKNYLEARLPSGTEVTVGQIANLTDPERPLVVNFTVKGPLGASTGKRLLLPAQLFENTGKPRLVGDKRVTPIDFGFSTMTDDVVLWQFPASMKVESAPPATPEKMMMLDRGLYQESSRLDGSALAIYRDLSVGDVIFTPSQYPELKAFFEKVEAKDHDSVVLVKATPAVAAGIGR